MKLIGYHNHALELASQYVWAQFHAYDRQFRMSMALSPILRWDRVDEDLRVRFLCTPRTICFYCNNYGHLAPSCPVLREDNGQPRSSFSHRSGHNDGITIMVAWSADVFLLLTLVFVILAVKYPAFTNSTSVCCQYEDTEELYETFIYSSLWQYNQERRICVRKKHFFKML